MRALPSIALGVTLVLSAAACEVVNDFLTPPEVVDARGRDDADDNDADNGCDVDGDCDGGEVCDDGACVGVCDVDGDCGGGEFCDDGRCRAPECVDDGGCPGGFGCRDFVCVGLAGCDEGASRCSDDVTVARCVDGRERLEACALSCFLGACLGEGEGEGEEGEGEGEAGEGEGEGEDLAVELTWSTATDDVDVHVSRASPAEFCTANDCGYQNKTTSWGARMDIDDLDGFGPERISARALSAGSYTILVDGYNIDATTTATLRVFVGGALAFESAQLLRDGDHWLAARVDVDGANIDVVDLDRVARQSGSCLGAAASSDASCSSDAGCPAAEFCNAQGRCAAGCRNDAGCSGGRTCNDSGVCVGGVGTVGYNGACSTTDECVSGLSCGLLTGTCTESCSSESDACSRCDTLTASSCTCTVFIAGFGVCSAG